LEALQASAGENVYDVYMKFWADVVLR